MFAPNEIIAAKDLGLYRGRRNVLEMKKSDDGTENVNTTATSATDSQKISEASEN